MIEHIIFGFLLAGSFVGAYLSARAMSRGPVFYRGKVFVDNARAEQDFALLLAAFGRDHLLQEEWRAAFDDALKVVNVYVEKQRAVAKSRGINWIDPDLAESKRLLLKLTTAECLRITQRSDPRDRDFWPTEPGELWGEGIEKSLPKLDRGWKDNIEQRLRALEEKAAAEDQSVLVAEKESVPVPKQIN